MRSLFLVASCLAISVTPVLAGDASSSATGVGIGIAKSSSTAVAISGQGGAGGAGGKAVGVGVANNGAISPSASVNIAGSPAVTSTNVHSSGSLSNVPAVFAPGLSAAGLETCLGSVSVGASWLGTGLTGGGSIPDPGCAARLDARSLWAMGLKKAAVARLCLNPDINRSMPDVCAVYLPQPTPVYAPVVAPARYASAEPGYSGGIIMLVDGSTGRERLCNDYNEAGQKCRRWADAAKPRKVAARKKLHVDPGLPAVAAAQPPKEDQSK